MAGEPLGYHPSPLGARATRVPFCRGGLHRLWPAHTSHLAVQRTALGASRPLGPRDNLTPLRYVRFTNYWVELIAPHLSNLS